MSVSQDEEALLRVMRSMKLTPSQVLEQITRTTGRAIDGTAPVDASAEASVAAMTCAAMIAKDIVDSSDLRMQQVRTGLGTLLKEPLPLSSLDAIEQGRPVLADEFFPFVGGFEAYSEAYSEVLVGRGSGTIIWQRQNAPGLRCWDLSRFYRRCRATMEAACE